MARKTDHPSTIGINYGKFTAQASGPWGIFAAIVAMAIATVAVLLMG